MLKTVVLLSIFVEIVIHLRVRLRDRFGGMDRCKGGLR